VEIIPLGWLTPTQIIFPLVSTLSLLLVHPLLDSRILLLARGGSSQLRTCRLTLPHFLYPRRSRTEAGAQGSGVGGAADWSDACGVGGPVWF